MANKIITVMVIDDEVHILRLIDRMLATRGFKVVGASNGEQALALMKDPETRPDIITCDVAIPDMDGFEILQAIKSDPDLADIPVIMLTAMGQMRDASRAKELGASDYITKPFSTMSLIDILQRHVQQAHSLQ